MKKEQKLSNIIIYQAPNGAIELKGDLNTETVWANQSQIADIFGVDRTVITKHIKNIFKDEELDEKVVSAKFAHTTPHGAIKGKTQKKEVQYYNLDIILAVGYRTKSSVAIQFRKWATQTLKEHITKGYTINKKLLVKNYTLFQQALLDIQKISQNKLSSSDVLELVKAFSQTWFSLDAFDRGEFQSTPHTQESIKIKAKKLYEDVEVFKQDLIKKGQATELFAKEKQKGILQGILGNIFQTAFGEDVYPSIESKASHLLYFIVKNHPFNDGNKRTGAFAFIWFLQKAKYSFRDKITPEALTAITLMIAISDPKEKQKMIDLLILLLSGK
jgi:death-on-curing family protein